jgi:hypothetical protein
VKIPLLKRRMIIHAIIFFVGSLMLPAYLSRLLYRLYQGLFSLRIFLTVAVALLGMFFMAVKLYRLISLYRRGYAAQLDERGIVVVGQCFAFEKKCDRFIAWSDITEVELHSRGKHGQVVVITIKKKASDRPHSWREKLLWYLRMLSYYERKNKVMLEYCKPEQTYEVIDNYWKQYR